MELVLYESKMQFMHRRRCCCRCRFHVAVVDKINTIDIFVMWSCIETTNIAGTSQLQAYKLLNYYQQLLESIGVHFLRDFQLPFQMLTLAHVNIPKTIHKW